jgi:hypothetical protein
LKIRVVGGGEGRRNAGVKNLESLSLYRLGIKKGRKTESWRKMDGICRQPTEDRGDRNLIKKI